MIAKRVSGLAYAATIAAVLPATVELSGQTAQFDASAEVFRIQLGLQGLDGESVDGLLEAAELIVQPRGEAGDDGLRGNVECGVGWKQP